jgi:hypothetical protein
MGAGDECLRLENIEDKVGTHLSIDFSTRGTPFNQFRYYLLGAVSRVEESEPDGSEFSAVYKREKKNLQRSRSKEEIKSKLHEILSP